MPSLALLAHSDSHGLVAPYVLRHARELAAVADRVVVVSSAPLRPEASAALESVAELHAHRATGGDWASWRAGLDHVGGFDGLDRLVLASDRVVGPLRPLSQVLGAPRPDMLRGITATGEHLNRYLLDIGGDLLRDPVVRAFWTGVAGVTGGAARASSADLLEANLSRAAAAAGWSVRAYFRPSVLDRARARTFLLRRAAGQALTTRGRRQSEALARLRHPPVRQLDPTSTWWYHALDGRLPYVRLDVLVRDPDRVGRDRMLRALEARHPDQLEGVREYLERTEGLPVRPGRGGRR